MRKIRHQAVAEIVEGDSTTVDYASVLAAHGIEQVQLVLMHPPYHDIIRFSEDARDLSNAGSVDAFVSQFAEIVAQVSPILEDGRYLAIVIGDKYVKGEWIPLGFRVMQAVIDQGYTLKSIVVKNFDETRAKARSKGAVALPSFSRWILRFQARVRLDFSEVGFFLAVR